MFSEYLYVANSRRRINPYDHIRNFIFQIQGKKVDKIRDWLLKNDRIFNDSLKINNKSKGHNILINVFKNANDLMTNLDDIFIKFIAHIKSVVKNIPSVTDISRFDFTYYGHKLTADARSDSLIRECEDIRANSKICIVEFKLLLANSITHTIEKMASNFTTAISEVRLFLTTKLNRSLLLDSINNRPHVFSDINIADTHALLCDLHSTYMILKTDIERNYSNLANTFNVIKSHGEGLRILNTIKGEIIVMCYQKTISNLEKAVKLIGREITTMDIHTSNIYIKNYLFCGLETINGIPYLLLKDSS